MSDFDNNYAAARQAHADGRHSLTGHPDDVAFWVKVCPVCYDEWSAGQLASVLAPIIRADEDEEEPEESEESEEPEEDFYDPSYDYPEYDPQTDHFERFGRPAFPNEY